MEQTEIDNIDNIYINPSRFIKLINDKCLDKLGRRCIENIYYSQNKKVVVEFTDGIVLNFGSYSEAFDSLNITYNLKLTVHNKKQKSQIFKIDKDKISLVDIAKYKIEMLLKEFINAKNVNLNNITLQDYFTSYEWKKNDFNKSEIDKITNYLEKTQDNETKKYVAMIKKILFRG